MVEKIKKTGFLLLSCILCSISINWIALPNGFPATGIAGISMVVERWTSINYIVGQLSRQKSDPFLMNQ